MRSSVPLVLFSALGCLASGWPHAPAGLLAFGRGAGAGESLLLAAIALEGDGGPLLLIEPAKRGSSTS